MEIGEAIVKTEPPIELLQEALRGTPRQFSRAEGFHTRWYDNPAYIALEKAIADRQGVCEAGISRPVATLTTETTLLPAPQSSEISDNAIIKAIDKATNGGHLDRSLAILDTIRPYLRTTEPDKECPDCGATMIEVCSGLEIDARGEASGMCRHSDYCEKPMKPVTSELEDMRIERDAWKVEHAKVLEQVAEYMCREIGQPVSVDLERLRIAYRDAKPEEIINGEEIDGTEYSRRKLKMALDAAGVRYAQ